MAINVTLHQVGEKYRLKTEEGGFLRQMGPRKLSKERADYRISVLSPSSASASVWPVELEFTNTPSVTVDGVLLEPDPNNQYLFILMNDETHDYVDALSHCEYYTDLETGDRVNTVDNYFITNGTLSDESTTNSIKWTIADNSIFTMEPISTNDGVEIMFIIFQQEI